MKRALITGVTGQDGSYLAELLLEKGYEVVVQIDADLPPGRVLRVLQTGYQLGDRVIRPAKVVVNGAPPAAAGSAGPDSGGSGA